jgi:hypothetical protein
MRSLHALLVLIDDVFDEARYLRIIGEHLQPAFREDVVPGLLKEIVVVGGDVDGELQRHQQNVTSGGLGVLTHRLARDLLHSLVADFSAAS